MLPRFSNLISLQQAEVPTFSMVQGRKGTVLQIAEAKDSVKQQLCDNYTTGKSHIIILFHLILDTPG